MMEFSKDPVVILLIINVIVLIAGCFLDAISIFYILLPIFLPIMKMINCDPILFGVILTVNVAIGQITPPVGVNVYVVSGIDRSIPIQTAPMQDLIIAYSVIVFGSKARCRRIPPPLDPTRDAHADHVRYAQQSRGVPVARMETERLLQKRSTRSCLRCR